MHYYVKAFFLIFSFLFSWHWHINHCYIVEHARSNIIIQRTQTHILDAVFTVHHGGNGHRGVKTAEEALADMADRDGYGIEGRALLGNDLAAGFLDVFQRLLRV